MRIDERRRRSAWPILIDRDVIRLTNGTVISRGISDGPTGAGVGSSGSNSKNCRPRFDEKLFALRALRANLVCERCGSTVGVQKEPCRTAYADPTQNIEPYLCRECAACYHDEWDEQWADYYSSQGCCTRSAVLEALRAARAR